MGPPFDGSTIPCSTLLSFCSSPGAKAARPLSGYPGLFLSRWATLRFDEILCRQKWCNIIAPKTIQNYSTQKLWRQKLYKQFPLLRFDENIWGHNSQFFVNIHLLRFDEKLCRHKWCNIMAPKTMQNYSTQNETKL